MKLVFVFPAVVFFLPFTLRVAGAESATGTTAPPSARLVEIVQTAAERGLLTPELDRELSALVLDKMGGAELAPEPTAAPVRPPEWTRLGSHVVYLLVPDLAATPDSWLQTVATETGTGGAAWVLDLRFTAGDAFADAARTAAFFKNRSAPIVLIGPETAGAGERLAEQLRQGGATLIGQPTSGRFCELRKFDTTDGAGFLLPVPATPPAGETAPQQLVPDVAVAAPSPSRRLAQGLTSERFRAMPERDPALRRAVDLASVVQALAPAPATDQAQ